MSEVPVNLGRGVLASGYTAGSGTMTVTPAASPYGALPTSGTFSIAAFPTSAAAGAIYTVSAVVASGGNQVLTISALEFGPDVNLATGSYVVEVISIRSLLALIVENSGSGAVFHDDETPSGTVDGTNTSFTVGTSPSPASSLQLFLNGVLQEYGVDYTLATAAITFASPPSSGSTLLAYYRS